MLLRTWSRIVRQKTVAGAFCVRFLWGFEFVFSSIFMRNFFFLCFMLQVFLGRGESCFSFRVHFVFYCCSFCVVLLVCLICSFHLLKQIAQTETIITAGGGNRHDRNDQISNTSPATSVSPLH